MSFNSEQLFASEKNTIFFIKIDAVGNESLSNQREMMVSIFGMLLNVI